MPKWLLILFKEHLIYLIIHYNFTHNTFILRVQAFKKYASIQKTSETNCRQKFSELIEADEGAVKNNEKIHEICQINNSSYIEQNVELNFKIWQNEEVERYILNTQHVLKIKK